MRKFFAVLLIASTLVFSGCGVLLPKQVELFQDKVRAVPEAKASERETQRQAASLAALKAQETLVAAISEGSTTNVIAPAADTAALTKSVSVSVGPPLSPSSLTPEQLSVKLDSAVAALDKRLDSFKAQNNENVGKKIEGTGLFQFGYFTMWAVIAGVLGLLWAGLKIYGMVNPVVGIGVNAVGRVSSAVLKKGFAEIQEGGEWFKEYLAEQKKDLLSKDEVLDLFRRSHAEAQSREVQDLIARMTKK